MCSIFPTISSYQEVMLILLRLESNYVLKLEKNNHDCAILKRNIINGISNLISTTGYSDEQLLDLIIRNYNDLIKLKHEYSEICKKDKIKCYNAKLPFRLKPDMGLSDVLSLGHKSSKNKKMNSEQKTYSELLFVMIKSVSLSLVKLFDYNIENKDAINAIIKGLNIYNYSFSLPKAKKLIKLLTKTDLELWNLRKKAQNKEFGKLKKVKVSLSTKPGKAILVSGSSLNDLNKLLEATKDINVDIYTHGDLLIAHAFEKLRAYKNLKGHFGSLNENCILDFATFPGPILLTRHATQNIEFLIRGRLFSTDDFAPKGVTLIKNNDFSPIISAANDARGFSKGREKDTIEIGFNTSTLEKKLDLIAKKFNNNEIKHLFIIGASSFSEHQNDYFKSFINLLSKDDYVISFSYNCDCENLLYINLSNNFPLQLNVLEKIFTKININSERITFFLTKCDSNTISRMISLKEQGAENVYLSDCPPMIINPSTMKSFKKLYSINSITNAKEDFESIIKRAL